jgi:hypothetical protein
MFDSSQNHPLFGLTRRNGQTEFDDANVPLRPSHPHPCRASSISSKNDYVSFNIDGKDFGIV